MAPPGSVGEIPATQCLEYRVSGGVFRGGHCKNKTSGCRLGEFWGRELRTLWC